METTNTQHTPAPWHVTLTGHIASQKGNIVAFTGGEVANSMGGKSLLHPDERRANAQLIARAPELLKENEQLRERVEALIYNHGLTKAKIEVIALQKSNAELLEKLKNMKDRFESKFEKTEGCWLWKGCIKDTGYGQFTVNNKPARAHRVSYELYIGAIPEGLQVLHTCDNRACVNPDHFFLGTNDDNMKDKVAKNRQLKGSKSFIQNSQNRR